jgi:tetratricopeptide (TPR) repeat protein
MSAQEFVTPDMLEVLAKVQSDPKSKLFAHGIQLGPAQTTTQPITGKEPFLSAAERKLIRAYREQVEAFLYARAFSAVRDSDWGQMKLVNPKADCSLGPDKDTARSVAQKLPGVSSDLVERVVSKGDPVEDLKLSLALIPSDRARIVLGLAYQSVGRNALAIESLATVERSSSPRGSRAIAAANRALFYWDQGEYLRAAKAYCSSLLLNPVDGRVGVFTLTSSLASGDMRLASVADEILVASESAFSPLGTREALRTSDAQGAKAKITNASLKGFCGKSQTSQQVLQFLLD